MADTDTTVSGHKFETLIRNLGLTLRAQPEPTLRAANEATFVDTARRPLFRVCVDGERTEHLTYLAGHLIGGGLGLRGATQVCLEWNARNAPPLSDDKVRKTVRSIEQTHKRKHPEIQDPAAPLFDLRAASADRFLLSEPTPRVWVLEDCLPLGRTGLLVAPGGTGKSQFVLQLAADIATGIQCFSPWAPSEAGEVVILGAEDEDEEFHRRLHRLTLRYVGFKDAHLMFDALARNLYIVSRVGENNLMTIHDGSEVQDTGFVDQLALTLKPLSNLRLIVIDPAARFRGGEENSAEDTTRFVEALERLAKLTGAAVLVVHHANKASMQGGEQNQAAARGSSALSDGVRLQLNLSYATEQTHQGGDTKTLVQYLIVRITKTNYSAPGATILLHRGADGVLTPTNIADVQKSRDDAQLDLLVSILQAEASLGRTYSKQAFVSTYGGLERQFHVGQSKLKAIVDRAVAAGRIAVSADRKRILTVRTPAAEGELTG